MERLRGIHGAGQVEWRGKSSLRTFIFACVLPGANQPLARSSIVFDGEAQGFEEHRSKFNFLLLATSQAVGKREPATVSAASVARTRPSTGSP